jgi:hypothetical protein
MGSSVDSGINAGLFYLAQRAKRLQAETPRRPTPAAPTRRAKMEA